MGKHRSVKWIGIGAVHAETWLLTETSPVAWASLDFAAVIFGMWVGVLLYLSKIPAQKSVLYSNVLQSVSSVDGDACKHRAEGATTSVWAW